MSNLITHTAIQSTHHQDSMYNRASPRPRGFIRCYYGVVAQPRTYANAIYLALGLPLGTAWFVFLVTGISVGAGLLVTLVGAPLLVAVIYSWRLLARLDAALTNVLLGSRAATRYYGERGQPWTWRGLGSRLTNGRTWGALLFLFLRFPQGIASFVMVVTIPSVLAALLVTPFLPGRWVEADISGWDADRWWIRAGILAVGVTLAPAMIHLLNAYAWLSGKGTELLLGQSRPQSVTLVGTPLAPPTEAAVAAPAGAAEAPLSPESGLRLNFRFTTADTDLPPGARHAELAPPPNGETTAERADERLAPAVPAYASVFEPAVAAEAGGPPPIAVDIVMRQVTVGGKAVELTPKEFDLFVLLVQNPHRPFSRDELLERLWKNEYDVTDRTIDTHILRLRKKLGEASDAIRTVWGIGYKFDPGRDQ